jgi:hypothetical protein
MKTQTYISIIATSLIPNGVRISHPTAIKSAYHHMAAVAKSSENTCDIVSDLYDAGKLGDINKENYLLFIIADNKLMLLGEYDYTTPLDIPAPAVDFITRLIHNEEETGFLDNFDFWKGLTLGKINIDMGNE